MVFLDSLATLSEISCDLVTSISFVLGVDDDRTWKQFASLFSWLFAGTCFGLDYTYVSFRLVYFGLCQFAICYLSSHLKHSFAVGVIIFQEVPIFGSPLVPMMAVQP